MRRNTDNHRLCPVLGLMTWLAVLKLVCKSEFDWRESGGNKFPSYIIILQSDLWTISRGFVSQLDKKGPW